MKSQNVFLSSLQAMRREQAEQLQRKESGQPWQPVGTSPASASSSQQTQQAYQYAAEDQYEGATRLTAPTSSSTLSNALSIPSSSRSVPAHDFVSVTPLRSATTATPSATSQGKARETLQSPWQPMRGAPDPSSRHDIGRNDYDSTSTYDTQAFHQPTAGMTTQNQFDSHVDLDQFLKEISTTWAPNDVTAWQPLGSAEVDYPSIPSSEGDTFSGHLSRPQIGSGESWLHHRGVDGSMDVDEDLYSSSASMMSGDSFSQSPIAPSQQHSVDQHAMAKHLSRSQSPLKRRMTAKRTTSGPNMLSGLLVSPTTSRQPARRRAGTVAGPGDQLHETHNSQLQAQSSLPRPASSQPLQDAGVASFSSDDSPLGQETGHRLLSSDRRQPSSTQTLKDLGAVYDAKSHSWNVPAEVLRVLSPSLSSEFASLQLQRDQLEQVPPDCGQEGSYRGLGLMGSDLPQESEEMSMDPVAVMNLPVDAHTSFKNQAQQRLQKASGQSWDDGPGQDSVLTNASSFDSSGIEDSLASLRDDHQRRWVHGRDTPASSPAFSTNLQLHGFSPDSASRVRPEHGSQEQSADFSHQLQRAPHPSQYFSQPHARELEQLRGPHDQSAMTSIGEFGQLLSESAMTGQTKPDDWSQTWPKTSLPAPYNSFAMALEPSQQSDPTMATSHHMPDRNAVSPTVPTFVHTSQSAASSRTKSSRTRSPTNERAVNTTASSASLRRPPSTSYSRSMTRHSTEGLPPLAAAAQERRMSQTSVSRRVVSPSLVISPRHRGMDKAISSDALRHGDAHSNPSPLLGTQSSGLIPTPTSASGSIASSRRRQGRTGTAKLDEVSSALEKLRQFLDQKEPSGRGHSRTMSAFAASSGNGGQVGLDETQGGPQRLRHVRGNLPPRGSLHISAESLSELFTHNESSSSSTAGQDRAGLDKSRDSNPESATRNKAIADLQKRVREMRDELERSGPGANFDSS